MAFRVEVTPQAEQDADTILEWLLLQHAGETGLRWFLRLKEAIDSRHSPEDFPAGAEVFPRLKIFEGRSRRFPKIQQSFRRPCDIYNQVSREGKNGNVLHR